MESQSRLPLNTVNGSRLPQPSKLRPPSKLKPPTMLATKRPISPADDAPALPKAPAAKKAKVEIMKAQAKAPNKRRSIVSSKLGKKVVPPVSRGIAVSRASVTRSAVSKAPPATTRAPTARAATSRVVPTTKTTVAKRGAPLSSTARSTTNNVSKPGGKRPAWDVKGRLEDMETMFREAMSGNSELQGQMDSNNSRLAQLEAINAQLEGTVQQKEVLNTRGQEEISALEKKLRESRDELDDSVRRFNHEIEDLKFIKSTLERQRDTLDGELSASKQECSGLKSTVASLSSAQAGLNAELGATKLNLDQALQAGRIKDETISELRGIIANHEATIGDQESQIREHETRRRILHNTIQELKGNIRVFCRVRPLLGDELLGNDGEIQHMTFPDPDHKVLELDKTGDSTLNESTVSRKASASQTTHYDFQFDRVFEPDSKQSCVFEEISQLVQSALDGYNVCIFAYGQTGSGKTFTMEGRGENEPENAGMIPRAVEQIFKNASDLEDKGWKYEMQASFLEIYNETIRDLLGSGKEDLKHEIKMVPNVNDVNVTNLTYINVNSPKQVSNLLSKAAQNRAVAETKCNERSSRSHSVFRLKLTGTNTITSEGSIGTLNLIDLAGSERLKESKSEGARLKETQAINKSLSNLGNVIMALANKEPHIPYRNSKLTYLLQNSLGGNSKTLMFVNVSPKEECFNETLCSLRFATKVNQCQIGTATKKVK